MSTTTTAMTVSELIGDDIITVAPTATLLELASVLTEADIGAVAVGDGETIEGIVSERDVVRFIAGGGDASTATAADLASDQIVQCSADSTVAEVANEMCEQYVRHVIVHDANGPVGIVSARDLLGIYASDDLP